MPRLLRRAVRRCASIACTNCWTKGGSGSLPQSTAAADAAAGTFHKRPLPDSLVAFSSPEGRQLFRDALDAGGLDGCYFRLNEEFHTQREPAFCGLGSLVMVLNAWRTPTQAPVTESSLQCSVPLDEVKVRGLTFDELCRTARANGAVVEAFRAEPPQTADMLREHIAGASEQAAPPLLILSWKRAALEQTGEGHFSPVAGYHADRDLALVLDTARFKYSPYWVPVPRLFEAMKPPDPDTGRPRGWMRLTRAAPQESSSHATL
eukprot:TRINITY_DN22790_c0_g1_i2.p1 TRINITY_DN22790_c0_g1~~TRINITY_DN22790_c0_g1_i2.p1  ORF type:complete len:291 (+),score=65.11 TRINITY_DN22790_c0_g1_i2:86-874(+)